MAATTDTSQSDAKPKCLARRFLNVLKLFQTTVKEGHSDHSLFVMQQSGLTTAQLVALFAIHEEGALSLCEIADKVSLSRPATSHLVDRLVTVGLLRRLEDEHDRRYKRVTLSPKGADLVEELLEKSQSLVARGIEALSSRMQVRLAEVLGELESELVARHVPAALQEEKR